MAAETPGPHRPARRAAFLLRWAPGGGASVSGQGGRHPDEDDSFYYRMHALLLGDPERKYASVTRLVATEWRIEVTEQLLDRTRRRYKKLLRKGFFSEDEGVPPLVLRELKRYFEARARRVTSAREDLELAQAEALTLGLDVSGDLQARVDGLTREVDTLSLLVSSQPHELQIHGLTWDRATLEESAQKHRDAKARYAMAKRELEVVERIRRNRHVLEATPFSGGPEKLPTENRKNSPGNRKNS